MASKKLLEKINAWVGPKFGTTEYVCRNYGIGPSHCGDLVRNGSFRSFVLKENAAAKRGIRLIEIQSVEEFFAAQIAEQENAPSGPSPVMAEARAAAAANRARRRKEKETAAA